MLAQMVGAHKPFAALSAGEALVTRMGPQVSLQLVASCKSFAAKKPVANKRLLTGMPTEMSLQMGCFAVGFAATGYATDVHFPAARVGRWLRL
ncbi:hypothetical protein M513_03985 [Trichuris suis]|uniref:Uncharacterized protein n=1 Tax=Trichuris suis TaxID=68888 RepID=A0A085MCX1_9BILA|nr:hypothetical protein M513_03985 [Trichuris suis]